LATEKQTDERTHVASGALTKVYV